MCAAAGKPFDTWCDRIRLLAKFTLEQWRTWQNRPGGVGGGVGGGALKSGQKWPDLHGALGAGLGVELAGRNVCAVRQAARMSSPVQHLDRQPRRHWRSGDGPFWPPPSAAPPPPSAAPCRAPPRTTAAAPPADPAMLAFIVKVVRRKWRRCLLL